MAYQQQKYTTLFVGEEGPPEERACCPFCHETTIGVYRDGGRHLQAETYCSHFLGFVAGPEGKPTAMYEGV